MEARSTAKKRTKTAAISRRPLTAHHLSESNCQVERLDHGACCQGIARQNRPTRSTKLIRTLMQFRKWSIDRPEPSGWACSLPPGGAGCRVMRDSLWREGLPGGCCEGIVADGVYSSSQCGDPHWAGDFKGRKFRRWVSWMLWETEIGVWRLADSFCKEKISLPGPGERSSVPRTVVVLC